MELDTLQNRYDEIDNLISTIDSLLYDIESKDIKEELEYIKYKYYDEREELSYKIAELEHEEERWMNYQFEKESL